MTTTIYGSDKVGTRAEGVDGGLKTDIDDYSISNPPPEGHTDLGKWVWNLFEAAYAEKERLGLMDRWLSNYRLYRGNHWGEQARNNKDLVSLNLFFANVQRTVANITAKNPVVEVVDLDGYEDGADQVLSAKMRKWWHETEQQALLSTSCLHNETFGITVEKYGWTSSKKSPFVVPIDPYCFFPAPNCPNDLQDAPYIIHAYAIPIEQIEEIFGVDGVEPDDVSTILGRSDREDVRPNAVMLGKSTGIVHDNYKNTMTGQSKKSGTEGEGLVIECWFRDRTPATPSIDALAQALEPDVIDTDADEEPPLKYPDGIRVVTITNRGDIVLADMINPNINLEMPIDTVKTTYSWGRFPFAFVNSYQDTTNIWGFAAVEQVGDLNKRINEIISRMVAYVNRVMFPPLIVEKGCGITKEMINNKPGLVLMPTRPNARIEFLQVPNLPTNFFEILNSLTSFHDRIYQIEDADRGVQPTGITAASAIVALQERNAVLIQHKIRAMEFIARERGRWAISCLQNFSTEIEQVEVRGIVYQLQGISLAGRKFNYMVESGSTVARTSVQQQEQAVQLYEKQAIDRRALLETLNFPNWKEIVERAGETQIDQALQILIDAGLDEMQAQELKQFLMQSQSRPEQNGQQPNQQQPMAKPSPISDAGVGVPRAMQGQTQGANI